MILKIRGIQKRYPNSRAKALKGIKLQIEKGEILALLGESGSGKSTLLKILAGQETADQGKMQFIGADIEILEKQLITEIEGVRLIDQDSTLPLNITIRAALERRLIHYKSGWVNKRISHLSQLCRLKGLMNRKMDEISGGQRQRAAIALAIADEPKLLLLDEAFTSLDFSLKRKIQMEWHKVIKEENISAIMVTHDPRDSLMFSDRIAIMQKGKIIRIGLAFDIYHKPGDLYTAELFGPVTEITEKNDSKIYLRPEDITLNRTKGNWKGKVIDKFFLGSGYIYKIEYEKNIFQVFSHRDWKDKELYLSW